MSYIPKLTRDDIEDLLYLISIDKTETERNIAETDGFLRDVWKEILEDSQVLEDKLIDWLENGVFE